jgi:hypothetical protein
MKNIISTSSMLFIYEQAVTDKYYNYKYHIWDNNLHWECNLFRERLWFNITFTNWGTVCFSW